MSISFLKEFVLIFATAVWAVTPLDLVRGASPKEPAATGITADDKALLKSIVANRSESDRARDKWRHPVETLEFFGVASDEFVVDLGPGAGWYTAILAPYLAKKGRLGAVQYEFAMWEDFVVNPTPERIERFRSFKQWYPKEASALADFSIPPLAFDFRRVPQEIVGKVDTVLIMRELHNYNRVSYENDFLEQSLADFYAILKPGGVVGIVQHRAPEDAEGNAASGAYGYLKESWVIEQMEKAGFVFEARSEINANPADNSEARQPIGEQFPVVWRLPPWSIYGEVNGKIYQAIGESDRMTLRFRKPK